MYEIIRSEGDIKRTYTQGSRLSIRLEPGGFSFYLSDDSDRCGASLSFDQEKEKESLEAIFNDFPFLADKDNVEVAIVTDKAVAVPCEAYVDESRDRYFSAGSIPLDDDDVIINIPCGGINVLAAVKAGTMEILNGRLGAVVLSHPLAEDLKGSVPASNEVHIISYGNISFITLYVQKQLRVAEALPKGDFASLLFYVNRMIVSNKIGKVRIVCDGDKAQELAARFGEYYAEVEQKTKA